MQDCEEQLLKWALDQAQGNITEAARLLGLPRSTLRSKLERNGN
jgi:DNA-binding protein Fis